MSNRICRGIVTSFVLLLAVLIIVPPDGSQARGKATARRLGFVPGYQQHNFVSDLAGRADLVDANLVNPWGLAYGATGPFWVANNGTSTSTLYKGDGTLAPNPASPLVVTVPSASGTESGNPTGIVFNGTNGFAVSDGGKTGPSRFIFASEDGTISGWAPNVNPTQAIRAITVPGAVYKGLAIGRSPFDVFLFAANFHTGTIDVFNSNFQLVHLPNIFFPGSFSPNAFIDRRIPPGFAPFGIQNIGGLLFVTYAKQEAPDNDEDVKGPGNGFVDIFDTRGTLIRHFAANGPLNSPWGLALAPSDFGPFSDHLLVGNFGDGRINAYNMRTGAFDGPLANNQGQPITIEGVWALYFGNGFDGGKTNELFFTAGIEDEAHGLFGVLRAVSN